MQFKYHKYKGIFFRFEFFSTIYIFPNGLVKKNLLNDNIK